MALLLLICCADAAVPLVAIISVFCFNEVRINAVDQF